MDVAKMVGELKAGRVEYRADRYGICHVPMGKVSFDTQKLVENYGALINELLRVKPSAPRASTSSPSSSPPRWARASRSTPPRPVTSWRSSSSRLKFLCLLDGRPTS